MKAQIVKWEEELNWVIGNEMEMAYMQGVKDGAAIVFALLGSNVPEEGIKNK